MKVFKKFFGVFGIGTYIYQALKQYIRRCERADREGRDFHPYLELLYCLFWLPACFLGIIILGVQTAAEIAAENLKNKKEKKDE